MDGASRLISTRKRSKGKQMYDLKDLLEYIDPAQLSYQEWCSVGMALKQEGFMASDWDSWSKADSRYKPGECFRKWGTFRNENGGAPVTGGTIVELAKRGGFSPSKGRDYALNWDSTISDDGDKIIDSGWLEDKEIVEPKNWNPIQELITYLETLFNSSENVGYVTTVYHGEDGRLSPQRGLWDRTAGQLIAELKKYNDIGAALGDYNPEAGAWIRFNPLDGEGIKNENVTDFRYALVESDKIPPARQNAIIRELELPVAALVYSGGKSVHAIVKIQAGDYSEYRKRVEYLYKVCAKNGLQVDTQNKNPSRLSRMPGIMRKGHKQFLMGTNLGKKSWDEWAEWIDAVNDDLPNPEELSDVWDNIPPLADCLIDGVLRKGHKMLLAGPSKAGKSFALIELTIAVAEGTRWLGFKCAQGKVLYVNLELDRASCLHRFQDVYKALGIPAKNLRNIDIWNLRGKSVPMDKLAPKLIRRSEKKNYDVIIIDPIYKVITGDENSADQMANFCNQFDKICTELHAAVVYCHHHSKGAQGGKKSMDRASGSGVFARDPDALLDLTELEVTDNIREMLRGKAIIRGTEKALNEFVKDWQNDVGQDDRLSPTAMQEYAGSKLDFDQSSKMAEYVSTEIAREEHCTAWRIEGTLREFASFPPLDLWFDYPIHRPDSYEVLKDIQPDDGDPWIKRKQVFAKQQQEKGKETLDMYLGALKELMPDGKDSITIDELSEVTGKSKDRIRHDFKGSKRYPGRAKTLQKEGYKYVDGTPKEPAKVIRINPDNE